MGCWEQTRFLIVGGSNSFYWCSYWWTETTMNKFASCFEFFWRAYCGFEIHLNRPWSCSVVGSLHSESLSCLGSHSFGRLHWLFSCNDLPNIVGVKKLISFRKWMTYHFNLQGFSKKLQFSCGWLSISIFNESLDSPFKRPNRLGQLALQEFHRGTGLRRGPHGSLVRNLQLVICVWAKIG